MTTAESSTVRRERDLVGDLDVPANAYWGVHTARSVANFPISGLRICHDPDLIVALADVKAAAALANADAGELSAEKTSAIVAACTRIRAGEFHDQFIVDRIQGGAGTSTNMNANEVIANIALTSMGHELGDYQHLHPVEDVNMSQSTNDVYPTAARVAVYQALSRPLARLRVLADTFTQAATEFADVLMIGRTQLQDAVPMTVGQLFAGFAATLRAELPRIEAARAELTVVNLGGTAIGTGLNTPSGYAHSAVAHLAAISGVPVTLADDLVAATSDVGAFVAVSAAMRSLGLKLSKTASDLRLLSSGPRAGFGDLSLPPVQAGSSIMPGKVNPVIPEVVNQVAYLVIGADATVAAAAEAGQLQLNAFEPAILAALFDSARQLAAAMDVFAERCVAGIIPNRSKLATDVRDTIGLATALNPLLGYDVTTDIAQLAQTTGTPVAELVVREGHLDEAEVAAALSPARLARPHG